MSEKSQHKTGVLRRLFATGRRAIAICLSIFWGGLVTVGAQAHRLNLVTTDIEWQAERRSLDITHRLHLEDALSLLATLGAGDGVLDLDASARLLNYIEGHFALSTKRGALLLEPFGAHLQGNTLFIYQRVEDLALPPALEVQNRLLHDIEPEMRNQVNWRVGDRVRSHAGHRDAPLAWLVL